jgi:hypothetical protein
MQGIQTETQTTHSLYLSPPVVYSECHPRFQEGNPTPKDHWIDSKRILLVHNLKKCVLCFLLHCTVYTLKGPTSFSFLAVRQIVYCHYIFAKEIFLSSKVGSLSIYSSSIYSLLRGRITPCIAKLWKSIHSSQVSISQNQVGGERNALHQSRESSPFHSLSCPEIPSECQVQIPIS